MSMFCYQCQEAARGTGCTIQGVCGKLPETAKFQDLLLHTIKSIAFFSKKLRASGAVTIETDFYITNSLFMTITNANFDDDAIIEVIKKGLKLRDSLWTMVKEKGIEIENTYPTYFTLTKDLETKEQMLALAEKVGVLRTENEDIRSLRELVIYGLKGLSAYVEHAYNLGKQNQEIFEFMEKALVEVDNPTYGADELVALVLETGKFGVNGMALLDEANTSAYGHPVISEVNLGVGTNPGILISGHDLKDIDQLLKQTENTGVDVYTHSEMLPAHYYPAFKKYKHFVGNYGGSWWHQTKEFLSFNGPVLFTSNCIVPPKGVALEYKSKIFTTNSAGLDGCTHIVADSNGNKDFSEIIKMAKTCKAPDEIETGKIVGGFAHNQVFALADKVVDAVKTGAIKKFFVMAGCDARMQDRKYYTEFAEKLPKDTVILTAGCAKYRYNKLPLGDIGGIPRVLDAGQCNDSYSLAVIALKLKEIFGLDDINKLPIAYNIAWYEQKAVIVLLALLYLGVKDIHLGPTLPAFLSPNVAKVLVDTFGIAGIGTVEDDIDLFMNK
ncbi:MAG: hydroxylamine reductase [Fusobacteriaceae bacterium]|mgnify:FL=1|nr:hydroxylamine reductase [Fusobacteriaceae bacterium]